MDTPICDFVAAYADSGRTRLHMPGHKGSGPLGIEERDITEIGGADVLYASTGIIRRSEDNAAALFGTGRTVYSTEGSSLCIRAMLYLTLLHAKRVGRKPCIAAARNAHKTFLTAAALLDMDICWLYPTEGSGLLSCVITPPELEAHLSDAPALPAAVYITSPDYLGNTADIAGLASVCHRHGVLLLVDNAHGAYLSFLTPSQHPMALGADVCCDSAHKTLPVLTGGAYLHLSVAAPALMQQEAENAMALFASTSPSYLILQSLDAVNRYLSQDYRERLADFSVAVAGLRGRLTAMGYSLVGEESLKITVAAKAYGYIATDLAAALEEQGVVCEFADPDYLVLMLTPESGEEALERLESALAAVSRRPAILSGPPPLSRPMRRLSPRKALFAVGQEQPLACCGGKVLASAAVSCPPAVPVVVCGEEIDDAAMALLSYYGVERCRVVDAGEEQP